MRLNGRAICGRYACGTCLPSSPLAATLQKRVVRTFFRVDSLLVIHDTVFRDVGGDFLRFHQLLRGWVLFLLHELRAEEESTVSWWNVNCLLNRENIETLNPAPAKV